ncbi:MAG TPA: S-methyl-5-thioribose-1-phosphate isomerase [archaeon]|nr:S-methyl-5-thioribose-1-phosphate isomerase [archaeon]
MLVQGRQYRTVWMEGSTVKMIDQTLLPHQFKIIDLPKHTDTADAIKTMKVRGAGAIGGTAGYGMAQVVLEAPDSGFGDYINKGAETIRVTRPTARNLFYAVECVLGVINGLSPVDARKKAVEEANRIADEDSDNCRKIGQYGAELIKNGSRISTHCNAGWLAFVDYGSALSPVYVAQQQGKDVFVYADETRPRGQGASLTAWELHNQGVKHAVIADNATGFMMQRKEIDLVIVGADRIAANGDVANKIGTYEKAVVAKENGIPFYVAAPTTTIDLKCLSGDQIPIEERSEDEVLFVWGKQDDGKLGRVRIAPEGVHARNPAFDVTPAKYVTGIITEKGIVKPNKEEIAKLFSKS